jgi:membrane-associated PAP2 superfamily phosphatase
VSAIRAAIGRLADSPWFIAALAAGVLGVIEATPIDLWVQDCCYDFARRRWVVDAAAPLGRLFFYDGPKALIILAACGLLVLALGPAGWRERLRFSRRDLGVAVLTLFTVPLLAGLGKDTTNTFCPAQIRRYGGDMPYVKLCGSYPAGEQPAQRGRCFPAGHASGGFALLGLVGLRRTRLWRRGVITLGLGAGWWMGGYQMLKGAHYLSHTVATMLLAWVVVLIWRRVLKGKTDGNWKL